MGPKTEFDAERVTALVQRFVRLRPMYPRAYLCLFDSLALLRFLASHHVFPDLIFGVIAEPFEAHCWLQNGSVIVNDDLERIAHYTPILSI